MTELDEQLSMASLFPDEEVEIIDQYVSLYDLPIVVGKEPSPELVRSVKLVGLIQPPIVVKRGDGYEIVDGRRRIAAARMAGLVDIPIRIVSADALGATDALTLTANATRAENPASELAAIEKLVALGFDIKEIAKTTGMKSATIQKRLRLRSLTPRLRSAFDSGAIPVGVAEEAAKLPDVAQARLVVRLDDGERLTHDVIREEKSARAQAAAAALPLDFFGEEFDGGVLRPDPEDAIERDLASVAARVINLGMSERDAIRIFRQAIRSSQ